MKYERTLLAYKKINKHVYKVPTKFKQSEWGSPLISAEIVKIRKI